MVIRRAKVLSGVVLLLAAWGAPGPAPRQTNLLTYRVTARITGNAGVTPLAVDKVITSTFTYDLKS